MGPSSTFLFFLHVTLRTFFFTFSLIIDQTHPESSRYTVGGDHKLLEKMNSLSSISSVDTDRFKATIENNFAKNNVEKGYKESPINYSRINNANSLHVSQKFNSIKVCKSNFFVDS